MKLDKDDITALFGTVILHLLLLILLYYGVLRTLVPLDDGGIPVNFGSFYTSVGAYEPPPAIVQPQRQTPPPRTTPAPVVKREEKPITQEKEQTVPVPETKKTENKTVVDEKAQKEKEEAERRRKEEEDRRRREEDERRRREAEQQRQQEKISNEVANAFGAGNTPDSRKGDGTTGMTNQGSPFGNTDTGASTGAGAWGSFNLNGRSVGAGGLQRPAYTEREEGRIVINITVDPNGNVISADFGRGTNIDNASMRNSAKSAAERTKFNRIQGGNNQTGTITYNYRLN